jgi:hypothetical protein
MLKGIDFAASVKTPGSLCGRFGRCLSSRASAKAAEERSGVKLADIKEVLLGNTLSEAIPTKTTCQIGWASWAAEWSRNGP